MRSGILPLCMDCGSLWALSVDGFGSIPSLPLCRFILHLLYNFIPPFFIVKSTGISA